MTMLFWLLAATTADPSLTQVQMDYMDCLSRESDAAVRQRVDADRFAAVADQLCEDETKAYRVAATGAPVGGASAKEFAAADAANRVQLVSQYRNRMRARRSKVAPPPTQEPAAVVIPVARYTGSTQ